MKKLSLSVKVNSHLQPAGLGVSYRRETHIVQNPDSPICTTEKERFELQHGKTVYPIEISTAGNCHKAPPLMEAAIIARGRMVLFTGPDFRQSLVN